MGYVVYLQEPSYYIFSLQLLKKRSNAVNSTVIFLMAASAQLG